MKKEIILIPENSPLIQFFVERDYLNACPLKNILININFYKQITQPNIKKKLLFMSKYHPQRVITHYSVTCIILNTLASFPPTLKAHSFCSLSYYLTAVVLFSSRYAAGLKTMVLRMPRSEFIALQFIIQCMFCDCGSMSF